MNKEEILNFINTLEEKDFNEILFREKSMDFKRLRFQNVIKDKFSLQNHQMQDKNFEYLSETLTNLYTLKYHKANSVLYKSLDSTGYDGAFLINDDGWKIYLSETKSSNKNYDTSSNNNLIYKLNEALSDLNRKLNTTNTASESSARTEDNVNIKNEILILGYQVEGISDENKKELSHMIEKIKDGSHEFLISATLSKGPNGAVNPSTLFNTKRVITSCLILENKDDVQEINAAFIKRMEYFYG